MSVRPLKNTYYLMRHGIAESNVLHVYSTDPVRGSERHPLTEEGRKLALESIASAATRYGLNEHTIIVASPFLRTRQTSEISAGHLKCASPTFDLRLRERFCGDFEDMVYGHPAPHLEADTDLSSDYRHVENLNAVWTRMNAVIDDLDNQYQNQVILLVSHGDPLDILYCGWHDVDLRQHHLHFSKFANAEIRPLL